LATSLQTYRSLIPGHSSVPDSTIEAWLEAAATAHSAEAFGAVFTTAMCMWVAAQLEPQVLAGLFPPMGHDGNICAPLVAVDGAAAKAVKVEDTGYWRTYQGLCKSRAAVAPFTVGPAFSTGWTWGPWGWVPGC
jgi:hypothetical protein